MDHKPIIVLHCYLVNEKNTTEIQEKYKFIELYFSTPWGPIFSNYLKGPENLNYLLPPRYAYWISSPFRLTLCNDHATSLTCIPSKNVNLIPSLVASSDRH